MLKTLLLIRSLNSGGAERQFVNLAKGLKSQKVDLTVAVFYAAGPLQQELEEAGIKIVWLGKSGRWDILGPWLRYIKLVRSQRQAIVYSWMPLANIVAVLTKVFLPRNTRIIWGIRKSYLDLSCYDWLNTVSWRMEIRLSRFADLIIANSYAGREYAINAGFSGRAFKVIPNGIDTDKFFINPVAGAKLRKEWQLRDDQLLIGLVGRLDPIKDHQVFLKVAAMVAEVREDVRFVCIGDGPEAYKKKLNQIANELGLTSVVTWTGTRSDMPTVHNALDILVSCSHSEGFPNVIGEAMACGVPCVVTDVGDSAWIVGNTGLVIPPKNPELLKFALLKMLDSICMQEDFNLGNKCRERIIENFSIGTFVDTSLNIMNEINLRKGHE